MPLVKKIRIKEDEISSNVAYERYNDELSNTLDSEFDRTLLILHSVIPADHFLWEWALDWKSKFLEHGKLLSILTSNKSQNDALNGMHLKSTKIPITNSVSHDLENLYKQLEIDDDNAEKIKDNLKISKYASELLLNSNDELMVKTDNRFEITGEYSCNGCGLKEVFLKGELAPACKNLDCQGLSEGWILKVELF